MQVSVSEFCSNIGASAYNLSRLPTVNECRLRQANPVGIGALRQSAADRMQTDFQRCQFALRALLILIAQGPATVYSDCPGCARSQRGVGRTRDDHPTTVLCPWRRSRVWWVPLDREGRQRASVLILRGIPKDQAMRLMKVGRMA